MKDAIRSLCLFIATPEQLFEICYTQRHSFEASSQTSPTQLFTEADAIKLSASKEALEMLVTFD